MSKRIANAIGLYLEGIRDGKPEEAIHKYTGERYTQHSTGVKDGKDGFVEFFQDFLKRNPKRQIDIKRAWSDGQYVFLHVYQSLNDGEYQYVTADFFDTNDEGKIIEHWDVISEFSNSNPSGRSSIDGATEITDVTKTEENKMLVRNMIQDVLMPGGDPFKVEEYISSQKYWQHNKEVADGLEHFKQLVCDPDRKLNYQEIVLCVGCGNFVATLCKATWEKQEYAQVDIFRIEEGKIVEHWDNVEPVPPQEEWANSGKF